MAYTNKVIEILRNAMENACQLSVPLQVEIGVGNCWADIH